MGKCCSLFVIESMLIYVCCGVNVDICLLLLVSMFIYACSEGVKPRFLMSGALIFSHNSQNMTYFVTKFGMRNFCVVP